VRREMGLSPFAMSVSNWPSGRDRELDQPSAVRVPPNVVQISWGPQRLHWRRSTAPVLDSNDVSGFSCRRPLSPGLWHAHR
jgi:hypothetical protein